MSEAQVAVTSGWTERTFASAGRGRSKARPAPRSLKAALSEAGLGEATSDPYSKDEPIAAPSAAPPREASPITSSRSPRLALFADQSASVTTSTPSQGVVSPPPWLRAARRSRWHARMLNTFGWMMTLVVAGSIIGVAGRYLAVPPLGFEATLQARQ